MIYILKLAIRLYIRLLKNQREKGTERKRKKEKDRERKKEKERERKRKKEKERERKKSEQDLYHVAHFFIL